MIYVIEYTHSLHAFAITSPKEAFKNDVVNLWKPGALHHLTFKADSREEVDNAYSELKKMRAIIVAEHQLHPEYGENYYAVYFTDLENIKYEIVCTTN